MLGRGYRIRKKVGWMSGERGRLIGEWDKCWERGTVVEKSLIYVKTIGKINGENGIDVGRKG